MSNTTNAQKAFNIAIRGFGYINRVREIKVERGDPYLALDVALMEGVVKDGDYSNINKTYLSTTVKGADAKQIIREHFTSDGEVKSPDSTVVASVNLGGLVPSTFTFKKGERAGQTGVSLKTALLKINWLKIGDAVVDLSAYDDQKEQSDNGSDDTGTDPAPQSANASTDGESPEASDEPAMENTINQAAGTA